MRTGIILRVCMAQEKAALWRLDASLQGCMWTAIRTVYTCNVCCSNSKRERGTFVYGIGKNLTTELVYYMALCGCCAKVKEI